MQKESNLTTIGGIAVKDSDPKKMYHSQFYVQNQVTGHTMPVVPGSSSSYGPVPMICPITNKTAKYRDPLTGQPFADKEAFKILREKYF